VRQVADELLEATAQDALSARHRKNLRLQLKEGFATDEHFASRPISEITTGELEAWLRALNVSPTTRNNYRTAIGGLFSFALRRGYVLKNPAALAERAKVKTEKPAILTVAEARALIENAQADFIPAVALGLFAGLRPESEVWPLDWSLLPADAGGNTW